MSPLTRHSLVVVWLATCAISLWDGGAAGAQRLTPHGISPTAALAIVWAGAMWDLIVGVALALRPTRAVRLTAAAGVLLMTLIATGLEPQLWLDPLGPLLKNLPLLALLLDEHLPAPQDPAHRL